MRDKLKKFDKAITGVIVGAVLPILGFLVSWPIKGARFYFSEYAEIALQQSNSQDVLIFCMLPNMFLFYFVNFRWSLNEFTKGLVATTLLLGIVLVVYTIY